MGALIVGWVCTGGLTAAMAVLTAMVIRDKLWELSFLIIIGWVVCAINIAYDIICTMEAMG